LKLTRLECEILQVIDRLPADCGEGVAPESLRDAMPGRPVADIRNALGELQAKQLIRLDENQCAALREEGAAALKGV
jgi:hypothetical protein